MNRHKLIIIGSGPAGYTAAIYAARAGLRPVIFTGLEQGGQLIKTTEVENFPGYPKGIQGWELMEDLRQQALRFGTEIHNSLVSAVDFATYPFRLEIDGTEQIQADAVILATGAEAKWLGLPSEKKFYGNGVSACAICDGFFFKGKKVAVVGGGDSAAEEALYLANLTSQVHLLVRKSALKASNIMQQRLLNHPHIQVLWNTEVEEILGDEIVKSVRIRNNLTQETSILPLDGLFVAIGHTPNSQVFRPFIETDSEGYVITSAHSTKTNIPGVFACGDVQDKHYRQAITAAGTGAMAALDAERFLSAQHESALHKFPEVNMFSTLTHNK